MYFEYSTGKSHKHTVHTKWKLSFLCEGLGLSTLVWLMAECQRMTKQHGLDIKTALDAHTVFQPHSWQLIQTGFLSQAHYLSIEQQMCHVRTIQMAMDVRAPWMAVLLLLAAA